jgi:hypothetical protein
MQDELQNHGFIQDEVVPEDFVFGAVRSLDTKFGGEPLQPDGDWRSFLFDGIYSFQAPHFETNSCTSHGTLNALELVRRRQFTYDQDLSDRYVAKGSGTDPQKGNTPKTVAEFIRKNWTVFEQEWSTESAKNVVEFYAELPQNLKTLSAARGAEWDIGYEYVPLTVHALKEALKYSPLGVSVPAWFKDDKGEYYRPSGVADSHWVCLMHIDADGFMYILDSYPDDNGSYIKIMRPDFMPQVAMRYYIKRQIVNQDWFTNFLAWIHSWVFVSPETPTTPTMLPLEKKPDTVPVKESKLTLWSDAMEYFESGGDKTAASYKRNNPGNLKALDGKFKVFETYEAGYAALCNYLIRAATNEHQAYVAKAAQLKLKSSGELTISQFIEVYAPDGPEINKNYTACIARYCNVPVDTKIRDLL